MLTGRNVPASACLGTGRVARNRRHHRNIEARWMTAIASDSGGLLLKEVSPKTNCANSGIC